MFDTIAGMLRGSAPDDLAHALGTDRTQTRRAMEIGLPALITGLRDKTLEPGGAQNLAAMLEDPDAALPGDVGSYLSAGDPGRGAAMLDTAFGDRGEPALSALAEASGLSTRLLAQVMSVLAPLATGTLRSSAPGDPDGLRAYLAGSVDDLESKGFGRVVELISPDMPTPVTPVAQVVDTAGPAGLDHRVDELGTTGGNVVTGAFPEAGDTDFVTDSDFADDIIVGADPTQASLGTPEVSIGADDFGGTQVEVPDFDGAASTSYPSDSIDGPSGSSPVVDPKVDFDKGASLSSAGWIWWAAGAVVALLALLLVLSQCGGDDSADPGTEVDAGTAATVPTAEPQVDPMQQQRQAQLDQLLVDYPGVTGQVVGEVALLTGTVADQRTNALVDSAVRDTGMGVRNLLTVTAPEVVEPEGYRLTDLVAAQPELSTLMALLDQAQLGEALDGNGPFTLFAPTNDAFAAIQTELTKVQADPELLRSYLQYHVVPGALTGADVASRPTLETLSGELIDVSLEGSSLRFNDFVPLQYPDASATNGVMHIVSGVLVPPSQVPVPAELGSALELNPITFAPGSANLTDSGTLELDKVVTFLLETPVTVEVAGHTDADGDEAGNQTLSQDRAQAVVDYLTSQGVPAGTLSAVGYGETQPVAPNDTSENKAKNRRIEFTTS